MGIILSIITVSYNASLSIEYTIKSVLALKNKAIEYIIIDGGSMDDTIRIIEKYKKGIDYLVSESDNGIYDAMNKGIAQANGRYLYFINAGDELMEIPMDILGNADANLLCFPVVLSNGKFIMPKLNFKLKIANTLPHQGCFYKKVTNFKYDMNFKIFADFFLNQTIFKRKGEIKIYKRPIVAMHGLDGISHQRNSLKEIFRVVLANYGSFYLCLSKIYFKSIGLSNKWQAIKSHLRNKKNI